VNTADDSFLGIKVTSGTTYTGSLYYRFPSSSGFNGNAAVSLQTSGGQVLGSTNVALSGSQTSWKQVTFSITANTTPGSTSNRFVITLDGAAASGQSVNFAMFSLFPPTFNNRPNGLRKDIAEVSLDEFLFMIIQC
jgi:alpha-N-arabinofuranosidase